MKVFKCTIVLAILFTSAPAWASLNVSAFKNLVSASAKNFQGRVGVGVIDVATGQSWYYNGDEAFAMKSVVKVPIVVAALRKVDAGSMKLEQEIPLTKSDVSMIRNAAIPDKLPLEAKSVTVASLIERSILRSNNGAVDVLTRTLGGPPAINKLFKDLQISGMRVDRYEALLNDDFHQRSSVLDSASPRALCMFLYKLQRGELLSKKSTAYLLDLMRHCQTGNQRIRAGLPKDWIVADKTGTGAQIAGVSVAVNDVAILTRPDNSSLVLSIFLADAKATIPACEGKIAEIAKDLFLSAQN